MHNHHSGLCIHKLSYILDMIAQSAETICNIEENVRIYENCVYPLDETPKKRYNKE